MGFDFRVIVVALSSFAMGSLAGSVCVPWLWQRVTAGTPQSRAKMLLRVRALPLVLATGSMVLAVLSFLVFEPRRSDERMGVVLLTLAVLGIIFVGAAVLRLAHLLTATRHLERAWMEDAEAIELEDLDIPTYAVTSSFPIVAVVGLTRPRMVVARSVLEACTPDELRAIFAHERGHLMRRDNLARAIVTFSPDVLAWLPIADRVALAWHDAAEEAADDFAGALGEHGRLSLAEALIRVARLAPPGSSGLAMPASALYRGENLEGRIRRLLEPQAAAPPPPSLWWRAGVSTALVASGALALHGIHELLEAAVTFLP
jgi:beta-lactamase regulating signal transducer with metallopeptidase domain